MERQENRSSTPASHAESMASLQIVQDQVSSATDKEMTNDGHSYANTIVRGGLRQCDDDDL